MCVKLINGEAVRIEHDGAAAGLVLRTADYPTEDILAICAACTHAERPKMMPFLQKTAEIVGAEYIYLFDEIDITKHRRYVRDAHGW